MEASKWGVKNLALVENLYFPFTRQTSENAKLAPLDGILGRNKKPHILAWGLLEELYAEV